MKPSAAMPSFLDHGLLHREDDDRADAQTSRNGPGMEREEGPARLQGHLRAFLFETVASSSQTVPGAESNDTENRATCVNIKSTRSFALSWSTSVGKPWTTSKLPLTTFTAGKSSPCHSNRPSPWPPWPTPRSCRLCPAPPRQLKPPRRRRPSPAMCPKTTRCSISQRRAAPHP